MKKIIINNKSKLSALILTLCLILSLSIYIKYETKNTNHLSTIPAINFDYSIVETDYNVSDVSAPMMYFNCKFILPYNFSYSPESESILRLTNTENNSMPDTGILGEQMINFIDIHCYSKGDPLLNEAFVKEIFDENTDSVKEYYMAYNNKTVENANKFYSKEQYQILNQNVDIQYYKSDENKMIAALSSELTIAQDSKDESTLIRTIYYYREDLSDTYVSVGTNEKIAPAQHYGIQIINSLKITDIATI